ncbi:FT-interacting protein 1-like protein [Tanacetum coccineum]
MALWNQCSYLYSSCSEKLGAFLVKDAMGSYDPYAEVRLGNYTPRTRHFVNNSYPEWNQVYAFFKDRIRADMLEVSVKDKDMIQDDFMGRVLFDITAWQKRKYQIVPLASEWYRNEDSFPEAWHYDAVAVCVGVSKVYALPGNFEKHVIIDGVKTKVKLASKIHMRVCLEGGYHVDHEFADYNSDHRPTAKQLWKNSIGVLEIGILSAHGLSPMKTKEGEKQRMHIV